MKLDKLDKVNLFGIDFDQLELNHVVSNILFGEYNNKIIVTPNVDHVIRYNQDCNFKSVYDGADYFLNDSRILKLLSKFVGKPLNSLIPGSDLTFSLFETLRITKSKCRIGIIGSTLDDIKIIESKFDVTIVAHYNPPMGFDKIESEMSKCVSICKDANLDIIFLAVGSPRQEVLAAKMKKNKVKGCYLCIGASLLFLSGSELRAPKLVQKLSLEWLFRLCTNPKRLGKRYFSGALHILPLCLKERFSK
jgi:N-acetylglucosaminyldiphosphoundecaprenol N-acetyl-beta-D-mannosaminyltransferase